MNWCCRVWVDERRYGVDQISGRLWLSPVRKLTSLRWMAALAMAWINHYLDTQSIEVESIAVQRIKTDGSTLIGMDEPLLGQWTHSLLKSGLLQCEGLNHSTWTHSLLKSGLLQCNGLRWMKAGGGASLIFAKTAIFRISKVWHSICFLSSPKIVTIILIMDIRRCLASFGS